MYSNGPEDDAALYFLERLTKLRSLRELGISGDEEGSPTIYFPGQLGVNLTGLRSLTLNNILHCEGNIIALVAAPTALWASLEKLDISSWRDDDDIDDDEEDDYSVEDGFGVAYIIHIAAPYLKRLRELRLACGTITADGGARVLERAALLLSELRSIRLERVEFGPGCAAFLLRAILPESLEELLLDGLNIEQDGAQALAGVAAGLPRMRHFRLWKANAGWDGGVGLAVVQAIGEHWPLLETLELYFVPLEVRGLRVLGSASRLSCLKNLSLAWIGECSEGVADLLGGGAVWLGTLEHLNLVGSFSGASDSLRHVKESAQALIRAAPLLASLTSLSLGNNYFPLELEMETMSQLKLVFGDTIIFE
jgi:hypothetical protein